MCSIKRNNQINKIQSQNKILYDRIENNNSTDQIVKKYPFINSDFLNSFDQQGCLSLVGYNCENYFIKTYPTKDIIEQTCIICKNSHFSPGELLIFYNFPEFICYLKFCFFYQKEKLVTNEEIFIKNQNEIQNKYYDILKIPAIDFSPAKVICKYCLMKHLNMESCLDVFTYVILENYKDVLHDENLKNLNSLNDNLLPIVSLENQNNNFENIKKEFLSKKYKRKDSDKTEESEIFNYQNKKDENIIKNDIPGNILKEEQNKSSNENLNQNIIQTCDEKIFENSNLNKQISQNTINDDNLQNSIKEKMNNTYSDSKSSCNINNKISEIEKELQDINEINSNGEFDNSNNLIEQLIIPKIFETKSKIVFQQNLDYLCSLVTDITFLIYLLNKESKSNFNPINVENYYNMLNNKANEINPLLEKISIIMKDYNDNILSFEKIIQRLEQVFINNYFPMEQFECAKEIFLKEYEIYKENSFVFSKFKNFIPSLFYEAVVNTDNQKKLYDIFNKVLFLSNEKKYNLQSILEPNFKQ